MDLLQDLNLIRDTGFRSPLLEAWLTLEKLVLRGLAKIERDSIAKEMLEVISQCQTILHPSIQHKQRMLLFTQELAQVFNEETWKDKYKFSQNTLREINRLLRKLRALLTTEEEVSYCYWRELLTSETFRDWSSYPRTESYDSDTSYLSGSVNDMGLRSKLFQIQTTKNNSSQGRLKWQRIYSTLSATSQPEKMASKLQSMKDSGLRSRKIQVYPTREQKLLMNKYRDCGRFIHNKCLTLVSEYKKQYKKFPTVQYLRDTLVNSNSRLMQNHPWMSKFAYNFRRDIVDNILKNYNSNFARCKKNKDKKTFIIKFKSKKIQERCGWSFRIGEDDWQIKKPTSPWRMLWGNLPDNIKLTRDSRFIITGTGKYFITKVSKVIEKSSKENIIVCDPGIRTFQTMYDVKEDTFVEMSPGISKSVRIEKHFIKKMQSKISKNEFKTHRQRYNFKKAYKRALERLRNRIDDLHKCGAKYLCDNYNIIIIPKLNLATSKVSRRIKTTTSTLSHCGFVERLITKSSQYNNCKVFVCSEQYTSKSCSSCGAIKYDLGANKTYRCNHCNFILDRDFNATQNILFKFLRDINAI